MATRNVARSVFHTGKSTRLHMPDPVLLPEGGNEDAPANTDDQSILPPRKKRARSTNAGQHVVDPALSAACHEFTNAVNKSTSLSAKEKLGCSVLLLKVLAAQSNDELLEAISEVNGIVQKLPDSVHAPLNKTLVNKSLSLL